MKREEIDEARAPLEQDLSATKPLHEYTGNGLEIIGEPRND
jgi:hypothetical protein